MTEGEATIEVEHAVGYSGGVRNSVFFHPNERDYITIAGGSVVVCDLNDPHNQIFLRGHDDNITCVDVSKSGRFVASGQRGESSDVVVWDFEGKKMLHRLEEHDEGIACLSLSHDDKLLATVGVPADRKIVFWDLRTGNIVASAMMHVQPCHVVKWGGHERDLKRRPTDRYVLAVGGRQLLLYYLDPFSGECDIGKVNAGHKVRDYVCLAFSPDMEYVYAGTTTGDFMCVNIRARVANAVISVCSGGLNSIQMNSSGTVITAGGGDGTVTAYEGEESEWVSRQQTVLSGEVMSLSMSNEEIETLVGTTNGYIYRMRCSDFEHIVLSENHSGPVTGLFFPFGASDRFVSCSHDGSVRLWDMSDYGTSLSAKASQSSSQIIPDSVVEIAECLVTGWQDGKIRAFDGESGDEVWMIDNAHNGTVSALCPSNNSRFFVSGGEEGAAHVWELRSRQMVVNLKEHTARITQISMFNDDAHILTASRDKSFLCWDLRREKRIAAHVQRMGGINGISLASDQTTVISVGSEKTVTYWDMRSQDPVRYIPYSNDAEGKCIALSHNNRYFVTGGTDQIVRLWDFQTGKLLTEGRGHSDTVLDLQFSPDDKQIVSVGEDGCVFIWNLWRD